MKHPNHKINIGDKAMRNLVKVSFLAASLLTVAMSSAWADDSSPVGVWKTIDDVSGKPKSLVRITESNGVLQGKIEKLFRPPEEDQNPKCDLCKGDKKDQPIIGLVILSGLKKDGNEWNGGEITDPKDGKSYKSKLELSDSGKKLQVRGYVGIPMFGRSQTWLREE
ncbi:uncharacterized protein (DUF2147 family) [Janthinobacterium sp. S3M3]|nr:uncharacterized protein (DUF2147 family) [Janthinobacterium sp. S3T4]MBB5613683.1 uncharacterized protein (DUF2147 family) [Janthinobacterium sp. S3M3]